MTLTLDNQPLQVPLSTTDLGRMYFYRIYFGGYSDYSRAPWHIYSKRGYKGCLEALEVNDVCTYHLYFNRISDIYLSLHVTYILFFFFFFCRNTLFYYLVQ